MLATSPPSAGIGTPGCRTVRNDGPEVVLAAVFFVWIWSVSRFSSAATSARLTALSPLFSLAWAAVSSRLVDSISRCSAFSWAAPWLVAWSRKNSMVALENALTRAAASLPMGSELVMVSVPVSGWAATWTMVASSCGSPW